MQKDFCFMGRPDGLGNRLEELIRIQEYCIKNNIKCIYVWPKGSTGNRSYDINIAFENIEIRSSITNEEKQHLFKGPFIRSAEYVVKFKFNFKIDKIIKYDTIIHVRGKDRLSAAYGGQGDFSTPEMLDKFIKKTIDFVNNDNSVSTYTIVSDDNQYIDKLKTNINKEFVDLNYDYDVNKNWLDFYYLTKPEKYILMCCKFSSYSITASILGNKELFVFKNSLKSNLPRYKAKINLIDG